MPRVEYIICDTDILIEAFKGNQLIINELENIGLNNICITPITVGELFYGSINKIERKTIKLKISALLITEINDRISDIFQDLIFEYCLSHKLSVTDGLIAATCLYYDIPLFTLNKKHFKYIPLIKLHEINGF